MVRCARLLASIPRSLGRRLRGVAVPLVLACTLPFAAGAAPASKTAPSPAPAPASKTAPATVPEAPPAGAAGLTVLLPLKVDGSMSKDSRRALAERLQAAVAAAKVSGGPYRARLAVRVSKKRDHALTLTVLGAGDATVAEASDTCKACSVDQVGARIDALVQQATASLAPKEPPPPTLAAVAVSSEPLGARVRIDGAEHGVTPQTIELAGGEHTVVVDKPGFLEHSQTITVEAGVEQQLAVKLIAAPLAGKSKRSKKAKGEAAPARPGGGPGAGRGLKIGGAVMLGLGVAGAAAGVAMILIDEDPMPQRCEGADVDFRGVCRYRYDTLMGGIIGTAAGAIGIGGGLAMIIKGHQISVRGRASKQGASLGIVMRF